METDPRLRLGSETDCENAARWTGPTACRGRRTSHRTSHARFRFRPETESRVGFLMRLLVVEDDPALAAALKDGLPGQGFAVDHAPSAEEALDLIDIHPYDAVLLDLGLPGADGLSVVHTLRGRGDPLPILILTARGGSWKAPAGRRSCTPCAASASSWTSPRGEGTPQPARPPDARVHGRRGGGGAGGGGRHDGAGRAHGVGSAGCQDLGGGGDT